MAQSANINPPSYSNRVNRLAQTTPVYNALADFLNENKYILQSPAKFTVATITTNETPIMIDVFEGTERLAEVLSIPREAKSCKLFLIENICPEMVSLLGERYNIDPQFFAEHLNNDPWYRIENIADRIPALPSSRRQNDFLQLRYVETETISKQSYSYPGPGPKVQAGQAATGSIDEESELWSDAKSFMMPDKMTTRIPRKAGKLIPRARKDRTFETILCTRQVTSVWFQKVKTGDDGWIGRYPKYFYFT